MRESEDHEMTTAAEIAYQLYLTETGRGGYTGRCPSCQYETGFSVVDKDGKTLFHCHAGGCSQREIIQALREYGLWEDTSPTRVEFPNDLPDFQSPPMPKANSAAAAREMWDRAKPAAGTVVATYLRARGYLGAIPISLRCVTGKHPADGGFHPIMLGAAGLPGNPNIVGVHRTFLRGDGSGKAPLKPEKMSLGDLHGASVPLAYAPVGSKVAVSEGIETGLSVLQATGLSTLAALSAGGLQALVLPAGVQEVFIAADHDPVGLKAANAAAHRWYAEGKIVRIVKPPQGLDFNDLARSVR
jgi:putative DNA primase/helicase